MIKEMLNGADGVCVCVPEMMPKSFFRNRNRCPDECVTGLGKRCSKIRLDLVFFPCADVLGVVLFLWLQKRS